MDKRDIIIYVTGNVVDGMKVPKDKITNLMELRKYTQAVWELGYTPMCPGLENSGIAINGDVTLGDLYHGNIVKMDYCDGMFMTPNWVESSCAQGERDWAVMLGKPIFHSLDKIVEHEFEEKDDGLDIDVEGSGDCYG